MRRNHEFASIADLKNIQNNYPAPRPGQWQRGGGGVDPLLVGEVPPQCVDEHGCGFTRAPRIRATDRGS